MNEKITVNQSVGLVENALNELCEFPDENMKSNFIIEVLIQYQEQIKKSGFADSGELSDLSHTLINANHGLVKMNNDLEDEMAEVVRMFNEYATENKELKKQVDHLFNESMDDFDTIKSLRAIIEERDESHEGVEIELEEMVESNRNLIITLTEIRAENDRLKELLTPKQ